MRLFLMCVALIVFVRAENIVVDEIVSVYDGDTFKVNISSYPDIVGKAIPIRVRGIDTPELRTKCKKEKSLGLRAKYFVLGQLYSANIIELRDIQRGKYFRIIASVYVDNKNLGDMLINNGLAVRYDGGTKVMDWCK